MVRDLKKIRFPLAPALVVLVIVALLIALLYPAITTARNQKAVYQKISDIGFDQQIPIIEIFPATSATTATTGSLFLGSGTLQGESSKILIRFRVENTGEIIMPVPLEKIIWHPDSAQDIFQFKFPGRFRHLLNNSTNSHINDWPHNPSLALESATHVEVWLTSDTYHQILDGLRPQQK